MTTIITTLRITVESRSGNKLELTRMESLPNILNAGMVIEHIINPKTEDGLFIYGISLDRSNVYVNCGSIDVDEDHELVEWADKLIKDDWILKPKECNKKENL